MTRLSPQFDVVLKPREDSEKREREANLTFHFYGRSKGNVTQATKAPRHNVYV